MAPWRSGASEDRAGELRAFDRLLELLNAEDIRQTSTGLTGDKGRDKGPLLSLPMDELPSPFPRLLCCPQPRIAAVLEESGVSPEALSLVLHGTTLATKPSSNARARGPR